MMTKEILALETCGNIFLKRTTFTYLLYKYKSGLFQEIDKLANRGTRKECLLVACNTLISTYENLQSRKDI